MKRILTIDLDTYPRIEILDCFAKFNGQSYRMTHYPADDMRHPSNIRRGDVVTALRKFADYIERTAYMMDDEIPDSRGDIRALYAAGRLRS